MSGSLVFFFLARNWLLGSEKKLSTGWGCFNNVFLVFLLVLHPKFPMEFKGLDVNR
uniref:Uncharacterized protein n=1 Tax=Arsenophonus nasoniae TaxID=638 RepID=D2U1L8_9GAMM|nr:hypothetical protein ARN_24520 [Arsenophonus nasoniae]